MDRAIARLIARQAIEDCVFRYMRGQDRLDAGLQKSAFHDGATVDYGFYRGAGSDFVDFAQSLLARYGATHHQVGQVHINVGDIEVAGDAEAQGEIYFIAYHRRSGENGPEDLIIAGRYIDRYACRDGRWGIVERKEVVDWTRTDPAADDWFHRTPNVLRGGRGKADPSFGIDLT